MANNKSQMNIATNNNTMIRGVDDHNDNEENTSERYFTTRFLENVPHLMINIIEFLVSDAKELKQFILSSIIKQCTMRMGKVCWKDEKSFETIFDGGIKHVQITSYIEARVGTEEYLLNLLCDSIFIKFQIMKDLMQEYADEFGNSVNSKAFVHACSRGRLNHGKMFVEYFVYTKLKLNKLYSFPEYHFVE